MTYHVLESWLRHCRQGRVAKARCFMRVTTPIFTFLCVTLSGGICWWKCVSNSNVPVQVVLMCTTLLDWLVIYS
jgi:hypothetical protein